MDRRKAGEELYRQKFAQLGLAEKFELVGRDWASDHGRKMVVKCKTCGAVFSIWDEVLKGRQKHMLCKECGASSDEDDVWIRSRKCADALDYYVHGHSVRETALKYGVTKCAINNAVRTNGLTNGREWQAEGIKLKQTFVKFEKCRVSRPRHNNKSRAQRFGCEYDPSVSLKRLIERDGLRCAICGEMCDLNDHSWSKYSGPMHPSIDHIIPMCKGGGHTWTNVQVAHIICNREKGDKLEEVGA